MNGNSSRHLSSTERSTAGSLTLVMVLRATAALAVSVSLAGTLLWANRSTAQLRAELARAVTHIAVVEEARQQLAELQIQGEQHSYGQHSYGQHSYIEAELEIFVRRVSRELARHDAAVSIRRHQQEGHPVGVDVRTPFAHALLPVGAVRYE